MAHLNRKIGIPSFDMTGKTAIITGGTQGLGFGMACALAAYGANVVITARTASQGGGRRGRPQRELLQRRPGVRHPR